MPEPLILYAPQYTKREECGYCNGQKQDYYANEYMKMLGGPSQSVGIHMAVGSMNSSQYMRLIDQGWRRSGTLVYKQDNLRNCCRYYTIRQGKDGFKITKKFRKVIRRFIREICDVDADVVKSINTDGHQVDTKDLVAAEVASTRFHTKFEPSEFSREKYELYKKYQVKIHHDDPDDVSEEGFRRFLCESCFPNHEKEGTRDEWQRLNNWQRSGAFKDVKPRLGPTHECYYLDNKLIAVSVVDFLPGALSSVYFIWDPDYAHLSLGILSSIRDITLIDQIGMSYYYMGYYIADCPKMAYKKEFSDTILDLAREVYQYLEDVEDEIKDGKLMVEERPLLFDNVVGRDAYLNQHQVDLRKNVIDELYSHKTFEDADEIARSLSSIVDMTKSRFPYVVPGLMPLVQLQQILQNPARTSERVFSFIDITQMTRRYSLSFNSLTETEKILAVDMMRLFGFEKMSEIICVVY
ncbi:hypothetical protein CANTEDRAFT_131357 [Yamadazyma tenuis ATCC 10573]|uniref:arginyltransferase n=1 Tax=Candida tenuis (strain ATCC 10573 / BCRC 21748 / CBS 615 / JCM 9827 / NBRC 10315 / NRRL Y-1498 / VKM Y-70) TaxID=590646 RepID=G3B9H5_CANTC|nr:uncharacterized protein CANTEDRAFT_131357 [Yamadazyma tenuis ATCC 10573]EGV61886.1 hypothetical protein CANTEDRAFT_131357 [Yamadazyma tenuis ATCC 10573]